MAHPRTYHDDDPVLAGVRHLALAFPGAIEKEMFGRPTFRCGKVFAYVGGSVRGHASGGVRDHAVLVLPDEAETRALLADPRFFVPAYVGPFGWVGLDLDAAPVDWREVAELLDSSYRMTAGARRVAELDALVAAGTDPVTASS